MPSIPTIASLLSSQLIVHEMFDVDAIVSAFPDRAAVLQSPERLIQIASTGYHYGSLGLPSLAGDDVDHAINGVCSRNRSSRPTDDLTPLDIFQRQIDDIPISSDRKSVV